MKRSIQMAIFMGLLLISVGAIAQPRPSDPQDEAYRCMFLIIPSDQPMKVRGRSVGEFETYGCGVVLLPVASGALDVASALSKFRSDFPNIQVSAMQRTHQEGYIVMSVDRKHPDRADNYH